MNQPFDEELISAYLDDELSPEQRRDVERLLAERPEAQRLLDELRGLRESLQSLPTYKLQDDFGAAVLRRAEREMLRPAATMNAETVAAVPPPTASVPATPIATSPTRPAVPVQPAAQVERSWRRPAAWSLLAVAAALAIMFVEGNRRGEDRVAVLTSKEKAADKTPTNVAPARPADIQDHIDVPAAGRDDETKRDRPLKKDGTAPISPRGDIAAAAAKPQAEMTATTNGIAGQPLPGGNQFSAVNPGVPPAGEAVRGNQMLIFNSAVPPPGAPAVVAAPAGQFAVENNLAVRGLPTTPPTGAGTVAQPQAPLAQQVLAGTGVQGYALPAQPQQGVVDMTPLIQANDYQRARTLIGEYETARREAPSDRDAAAQLSRRMQNRAMEQQATRQAPAQAKTGVAAANPANVPATDAEQLLVVYCDVTPEALERGWGPILNRQQIADLTTLYSGTTTINGVAAAAPDRQAQRRSGQEQDEEFVYVVADSKQLEGTLDALRRQSEYFLNVRVEPAPADPQQQTWRQRYSRGEEADRSNAFVVKNTPATTGDARAVAKSLAENNAPAPAGAPAKANVQAGERKEVGEKNTAALAKSESASGPAVPLNEIPRLREAEGNALQFGGGNAAAGMGGGGGMAASAAGSMPTSSYEYRQQTFVPLSRSQRLNRSETLAAPATNAPLGGSALAAAQPAATPSAAPQAAIVATSPFAAPAAAKPAADEKLEKSKVAAGGANGGRPAPTAAKQMDADAQSTNRAFQDETSPAIDRLWSELPPDYHEALFIFRVVPQAEADSKSNK